MSVAAGSVVHVSDVERPQVEQDGKPERNGDHQLPEGFLEDFERKLDEKRRRGSKP